jgi:3-hydroxyacyl-CoA dehydrogenase
MSEDPRPGYIGIGNMGEPMALRLLVAGFDVNVWGRTRAKLDEVIGRGAIMCAALVTELHRLLARRQHADEAMTTLYKLYRTSRLDQGTAENAPITR